MVLEGILFLRYLTNENGFPFIRGEISLVASFFFSEMLKTLEFGAVRETAIGWYRSASWHPSCLYLVSVSIYLVFGGSENAAYDQILLFLLLFRINLEEMLQRILYNNLL